MSAESNDKNPEVAEEHSESYSEAEDDNFIVDDENDDIVYAPGYDPDQELQQKRARLDYKLKSTFESIFEKYGKDFDGVGDEIDLLTGEILVDNGHLKDMLDERDAGEKKAGGSLLRALTVEPESVTETSGDECSIEEEAESKNEGNNEGNIVRDELDDRDNAADISDGDMEEDDMILRGYDEPKQNPLVDLGTTTESESAQNHAQDDLQHQDLRPERNSVPFPSYNEIFRSFGPAVAPQIVNIISRNQGQDDSHIEPAWRAPELPVAESGKRPELRAFIPEPEFERSPSPDMSESIWALPKGRSGPRGPRGPYKPKSLGNRTFHSDGMITSDYTASDSPRIRNRFTKEEDELLIAKVAEANDRGLPLETDSVWKELEDLNSRHSRLSWKNRYRSKYLHLWSSKGSTTPVSGSRGPYRRKYPDETGSSVGSGSRSTHAVSIFQRPSRTRKPIQRSNVISWSDAVATIKTLDPRLHKDLAKDASAYDLTDIRPVDVDEDALNLRSSDLDLSNESDVEPELPVHIQSGVRRIAPVAINTAYEFSDEEAGLATSSPKHKNAMNSLPKTYQYKGDSGKPSSSKSGSRSTEKPKSRQRQLKEKFMSEEVDELSFGIGEDDVLFVSSLPRKDKQREPRILIKREDEQLAAIEKAAMPWTTPNAKMLIANDDFDELDELSVDWLVPVSKPPPKPAVAQLVTTALAETTKKPTIDLFDIDQLPETSPRSVLDARKKSRMNKRFGSSAVIPSTSSQPGSSPSAAVDGIAQWRTRQKTDSVIKSSVPSSSQKKSSPNPRPKRKFAEFSEKDTTLTNSAYKSHQKTKTPVSDAEDAPLRSMISADITPTQRSANKRKGGIFTPNQGEAPKSRTPLLDYTTPTRRDSLRKWEPRESPRSPGMVQTPGGTFRKCGHGGISCGRAFCFKCGLSSKKMGN